MQWRVRDIIIRVLLIVGLPVTVSLFYYQKLRVFESTDRLLRAKMDYLYESTERPDVVFMGSSRAMNHFDTRVFDSVCGVNSYNLGLDGAKVTEMRMLLKVCIEKHKIPALLVINVDPATFDATDPIWSFVDILEYAKRDTVVRDAMADAQDVFRSKWKYPFYRLQRLMSINDGFKVNALLKSKSGLRKLENSLFEPDTTFTYYKGFKANYLPYTELYLTPFELTVQDKGFELFRDMMRICRQEGIKVVLVTTPMYEEYRRIYLNAGAVLSRVTRFAAAEGVTYVNDIDDTMGLRKENFFDFGHLNGEAARRYSLGLARLLKPLLHQQASY